MQIKTIYQMVTIQALKSPREYIDTRVETKPLPRKIKKRETFLKEIQKLSKQIPGPGKYIINPQNQKISKTVYKKVDFKAVTNKPKETYLDDLIKKKNKIPGIGKYQLTTDNTAEIRQRYSVFGDRARKNASQFKQTIFDDMNIDVLGVDPGIYETMRPLGSPKRYQTFAVPPPHPSNLDKGDPKLNKKSVSLPKIPGPQSYHPVSSEYTTFEKILSRKSLHQVNPYGKKKKKRRVSEFKQMSPGPKYSLIAEWSPKNKDHIKNMFKSTKNLLAPSVYH